MASSLFVNSMRYTPRSFRIGLPRVPISIVLPFQERKITKFRMSIMNPGPGSTVFVKEPFVGFLRSLKGDPGLSDTFMKTAMDCVRKNWSYLGWIAASLIYVGVLLKEQLCCIKLRRFHTRVRQISKKKSRADYLSRSRLFLDSYLGLSPVLFPVHRFNVISFRCYYLGSFIFLVTSDFMVGFYLFRSFMMRSELTVYTTIFKFDAKDL